MVKQRLSLVTLGVKDVAVSRAFYESLGFEAEPFDSSDVVFFDMNGVVFGLYGRAALAKDANVSVGDLEDKGDGFHAISVAINLESEAEVDATLAEVAAKGGTITKPAEKVFWSGYSGYFADPDGHLWEVAHNPFWSFDEDGRVMLPSKQATN